MFLKKYFVIIYEFNPYVITYEKIFRSKSVCNIHR